MKNTQAEKQIKSLWKVKKKKKKKVKQENININLTSQFYNKSP